MARTPLASAVEEAAAKLAIERQPARRAARLLKGAGATVAGATLFGRLAGPGLAAGGRRGAEDRRDRRRPRRSHVRLSPPAGRPHRRQSTRRRPGSAGAAAPAAATSPTARSTSTAAS